jgi:hypothetical protein
VLIRCLQPVVLSGLTLLAYFARSSQSAFYSALAVVVLLFAAVAYALYRSHVDWISSGSGSGGLRVTPSHLEDEALLVHASYFDTHDDAGGCEGGGNGRGSGGHWERQQQGTGSSKEKKVLIKEQDLVTAFDDNDGDSGDDHETHVIRHKVTRAAASTTKNAGGTSGEEGDSEGSDVAGGRRGGLTRQTPSKEEQVRSAATTLTSFVATVPAGAPTATAATAAVLLMSSMPSPYATDDDTYHARAYRSAHQRQFGSGIGAGGSKGKEDANSAVLAETKVEDIEDVSDEVVIGVAVSTAQQQQTKGHHVLNSPGRHKVRNIVPHSFPSAPLAVGTPTPSALVIAAPAAPHDSYEFRGPGAGTCAVAGTGTGTESSSSTRAGGGVGTAGTESSRGRHQSHHGGNALPQQRRLSRRRVSGAQESPCIIKTAATSALTPASSAAVSQGGNYGNTQVDGIDYDSDDDDDIYSVSDESV